MNDVVREVEEAFVAHWSLLGQWPGARLIQDGGVLRFETPIRKLPYNAVLRTAIEDGADDVVVRVVDAYAVRESEFMWLVHPSATPDDLAARLEAAGLTLAERAIGMSLDRDTWSPADGPGASGGELAEVGDEDGLRTYVDLTMGDWEVDEADREQVARLNRHWSGARARGRRWLAFVEGRAVGKGYLSLAGPPGVAAIFGMSVLPEARGHGIASVLTETLLGQAKTLGCRRVVLHSSEMAVGVYRRAGFVERCPLRFFATAPIWSGKH
jgi:ribosomal protein S18 acetylase RimI-like enzyme